MSRGEKTRSPNQRGIALLLTLLIVTLLTIVVMEFTYSTEVEAHLTRNALSAVQARYLARAGVALAELALQIDATEKAKNPPERPNVETLADPWAQPYPPQPFGDGVGEAGFVIEDLAARFNVNSLALAPGKNPVEFESRKMLFQGVLAAVGLDVNLLFPLLDWLDADDEVTGKSGAEKEYYLALPSPYLPRNGRLLRLEELSLVRGFSDLTRPEWAALRSMLTVLPNTELQININTAPELLLTAIFTAVDNPAAGKAIVNQREQHPIMSLEELKQVPGWAQAPPQVQKIFNSLHTQYFLIHAVGIAGDVTRGLAVSERRSGARLDILDWREEVGTVSLTSPAPSVGIGSFRP